MKFILGIANFDKNYNFSNSINQRNINSILRLAYKFKFREIDTANSYLEANKILNRNHYKKKFLINTKISNIKGKKFKNKIDNEIKKFKKQLDTNEINTLLFHDRKQIFEKNIKDIISYILELKKNKIIKKFGFSIYNYDELKEILKYSNPDIIQFPGNIFDHRYLNKKNLGELKKRKIEIQVRSIFLQGITLKRLYPLKDKKSLKILKKYWNIVDNLKLNPLKYNVNFLKRFKNVDKFIVSFENHNQMIELIKIFKSKKKEINKGFKTNNLNLINPYLWKKK